ncbi:hypothetical protein THAOC_23865 [Thalassiosira oceanica]|uniref:Uncharacterized protein n=1 Tax=Thalassiosira oceanica TaxID=159749 RepID=K0RR98_THAOC|nr:hypothetical protein THAOC_23865 [Thalassiosira oceanica]|eukprot:EJK56288.1 hypothetical protein THAOC_23865 [Thalassiosira oceanica]
MRQDTHSISKENVFESFNNRLCSMFSPRQVVPPVQLSSSYLWYLFFVPRCGKAPVHAEFICDRPRSFGYFATPPRHDEKARIGSTRRCRVPAGRYGGTVSVAALTSRLLPSLSRRPRSPPTDDGENGAAPVPSTVLLQRGRSRSIPPPLGASKDLRGRAPTEGWGVRLGSLDSPRQLAGPSGDSQGDEDSSGAGPLDALHSAARPLEVFISSRFRRLIVIPASAEKPVAPPDGPGAGPRVFSATGDRPSVLATRSTGGGEAGGTVGRRPGHDSRARFFPPPLRTTRRVFR